MAKKSVIARNLKRKRLVEKFAAKRSELKAILCNTNSTPEQLRAAERALYLLPRNSAPTRVTNRCELSGRRRAFMRKFGVSRIQFRELASEGKIPGVTKSSW